ESIRQQLDGDGDTLRCSGRDRRFIGAPGHVNLFGRAARTTRNSSRSRGPVADEIDRVELRGSQQQRLSRRAHVKDDLAARAFDLCEDAICARLAIVDLSEYRLK